MKRFTRSLKRKCVVCGRSLKINILDNRGHYINGHYFGKFKIPIKGTGEYKKVGVSKIFKKKVDIVEWTGKEKEFEYWECEECYNED